MELSYITRTEDENGKIQITSDLNKISGKPRVYFSCHPDDFERVFSEITEDILKIANCVIWYNPEPASEPEYGELTEALSQMQLVVFAISPVFLDEKNRAKDIELPYALEHHIPVLPIMLEPGLGGKFSKQCAKIQVVNKKVTDPTATPYEDVLRTYLNSVLIGDELAQKVRDAFDAYVFLSYRKKDRSHAQRLMHMIHENPEFRDIAIWYDEFLVPGEGFNEAIRDAFLKSSIFAMAVTPHLEEDGNYVMRVEYPMARDRRKKEKEENEKKKASEEFIRRIERHEKPEDDEEPEEDEKIYQIVPVEMYEEDKTDPETGKPWRINQENLEYHEEFRYRKIDDLHDEHRRPELDDTFIEALKHIAKKENDGSSRHQFFIGLAYLTGIDVEINQKRGVDLIKTAANDKKDPCLDATQKLVDMYVTGDGVPVDYNEAIHWQKQLCDQYQVKFLENHSPDEHLGYGTRYFKSLLGLSDLIKEVGDTKGARTPLKRALEVCEKLPEEVGKRETDRDKAVICTRIGNLYRYEEEWEEAERYYLRAETSYQELAREIGTPRARRDLSIARERLGDIARKTKAYPRALNYYKQVLDAREELAANTDSLRAQRDLSSAFTKIAAIYKEMDGDLLKAKGYYDQAFRIDKNIAKEERTARAWDDYAVSLIKQGDLCKGEKHYKAAADYYKEAREVFRKMTDGNVTSLRARRNYAASCEKLASAGKRFMNAEEVDPIFEEAIRVRESIMDGFKNPVPPHELAVAYYNYGLYKQEEKWLNKALEIWLVLAARNAKYSKYIEKVYKALNQIKEKGSEG